MLKKALLLVVIFAILPTTALIFFAYSFPESSIKPFLGTDIPKYENWLEQLKNSESFWSGLFVEVTNGTRPLSLFVMFSLSEISDQNNLVILEYLPLLLAPALVLSVYFLVRTMYPGELMIAVVAAIMTAVSHQIVAGFYGALYANWFGLIMIFLSCLFLLKSLRAKHPSFLNISLYGILGTLALFFHSFTWSFFIVAIVLFLIWTGISKKNSSQSLKVLGLLSIVTITMISIDFSHSYYIGTNDSFTNDLINPATSFGLNEFANLQQNLFTAFTIYLGGFLTNSAVLLLVFLWAISAKYCHDSDRFLLCILFVSLIPILMSDFVVQSRIIYNLPLQIPASIIMVKFLKSSKFVFGIPLFFVILLMQFNYALRAMANMNFLTE